METYFYVQIGLFLYWFTFYFYFYVVDLQSVLQLADILARVSTNIRIKR